MKKLKFLLIIGLVTVLSGCKFEYNMNIDKDKKVDFDVILAVPTINFGDTEKLEEIEKNSKKGAAEDSAYGVVDAAKLYWASNQASFEQNNSVMEFECTSEGTPKCSATSGLTGNLEISGTKPTGGKVTISNGKVIVTDLIFGEYKCSTIDSKVVCEINDDESLTTEEESDDSLLNTTKIDCDELQAQLTTWKVEVYDDGTNKGCKLHKTYSSIDDISNDKEVSVELLGILKGEFDDTQLFTKNNDKYTAHFTFNMDTLVKESGEEMDEMTKAMMSMAGFKYSIELPYKNLSNNASTVENDGKKLTWTLDGTKDNEIKFSFDFNGKKEIPWLYIGFGAGALLVIIVLCIVLGKGKKCDCSNCTCDKKEVDDTPVEPALEKTEEPVIENEKPEVVEEPVVEEVTEETEEQALETVTTEENTVEVTNENVEESVEPITEEPKDNQ